VIPKSYAYYIALSIFVKKKKTKRSRHYILSTKYVTFKVRIYILIKDTFSKSFKNTDDIILYF